MDQSTKNQTQAPPVQAQAAAPAPEQKKSQAWIWILGGCLGIFILGMIAFLALGWWGVKKVKKEAEKYTPTLEQMQENADKWNRESEEWQKKSEEYRESVPNPEDLQNQLPPPREDYPYPDMQ